MIIKKGKTNWLYILLIVVFAVAAGGEILVLQQKRLAENSASLQPLINQRIIHRPTETDPNFLTQAKQCFIPIAAAYGFHLDIMSGFRTWLEQNELFALGRSDDGEVVTWAPAGKSLHNYGYAVDVAEHRRHYNIDWTRIGAMAEYCGLVQGEDEDYAHFENRGGLTTADFITGQKPPLLTLPCAIMAERAKTNEPLTLKDLKDCGAPIF